MRADLIAAIRALRASATFTAVALLVLGLGIGASTAIFSVVDAVVLRGLPFDEHDRLVAVGHAAAAAARSRPGARSRAAGQRRAAGLHGLGPAAAGVRGDGRVHRRLDDAARARRRAGGPARPPRHSRPVRRAARDARPSDGRSRRNTKWRDVTASSVLSDALWRRRFGADPGVIGRTIPLEGEPTKCSASCRRRSTYPVGAARATDFYVPYVVPASERIRDPNGHSYLPAGGRPVEAGCADGAGRGADGSDWRRAAGRAS